MDEVIKQKELFDLQTGAMDLADRLPLVMFEARKVSHSVAHGIHGRKRSGPGDNFWQYRKFQNGDSASLIDWRKSASSNQLYIREKEWEAAHTIWLWPDLSSSMNFQSGMAGMGKMERALVLMLALGQVMINGGERVGVLGYSAPTASRNVMEKLAEVILGMDGHVGALPPQASLSTLSECVIFTDCLAPFEDLMASLEFIAAQGVRGHLVHIIDPVEEIFPYSGRTEFRAMGISEKLVVERAEGVREGYKARFAALKQDLKANLEMMRWSYLIHHTDRPASEALMALYTMISDASLVGYFDQMQDGEDL